MLTRGLLEPGRSPHYRKYALFGQRKVDGWLEDIGLVLVDRTDGMQRDDGISGGIAEIGIHHGRLFVLLALLRQPGEPAVAVDLFEDQHLNVDSSGKGDREVFEANLRQWDPRHAEVKILKADSWTVNGDTLRELAGGGLRLISIDGGHTAALTTHDLETACDALIEGGVVILDDCFNQFFPSVAEGSQEFFRAHPDFVPFFAGGNKTLICHADFADRYRVDLMARVNGHPMKTEEREFLGRRIAAAEALYPVWRRRWWRRYAFNWVRRHLHL